MTTRTTANEISSRKGGAPRKPRTVFAFFGTAFVAAAIALGAGGATEHAARAEAYKNDPVSYARDVLGVEPWERPVEVLNAVRDHARVVVRSGHKVSKSHTAAIAALWFYDCFEDARVVITCVTARQVNKIVWREVKMLRSRALRTIEGDMRELAQSGMTSDDFREIVGFTASEAEAVAGVSGKNLLYIVDEASGVPDEIYEAIEGNRAGGARILMLSNPTRTEGEFFEAFHDKKDFYRTITISSEESPNVIAGRVVIPGLATAEYIEEKKLEWGVDSALYKIRIKGEHVLKEDGKILSVHDIGAAEDRWHETVAVGRLHLGIDPAGPAEGGDESTFAPRRGKKVIAVYALRGLTAEAHVAHALGFLETERKPGELPPLIKIDREGPIGSEILGLLRAHLEAHPNAFEVVGVRSSDKASRRGDLYDRRRDELWANGAQWIKDGGAIPEDTKLAKELHAPEWFGLVTGRLKATGKDELKKILGRSPDRADALNLAVWEPSTIDDAPGASKASASATRSTERIPVLNPYESSRAFNPYGGGR